MAYTRLLPSETETIQDRYRRLENENTALRFNNIQLIENNKKLELENRKLKQSYRLMLGPMKKLMEIMK